MKKQRESSPEKGSSNIQTQILMFKSANYIAKFIRFTLHNIKNILAFIFVSKMRLK